MCLSVSKRSGRAITCPDRIAMTLAPCLYLDDPDMAYNDCCLLMHENKNGLNLYIPPLIEIGGTYTNLSRPINFCWILTRFAISFYLIAVIMFTSFIYVKYYQLHFMFIYFTHWTVICSAAYIISSLISSIKVYKKYVSGSNISSIPYQFRSGSLGENDINLHYLYTVNKILLQICIPCLSLITFNFWILCDQIPVSSKSPSNELEIISAYQLYGYVLIAILIDFIISAQKLYYKSAIWAILFFTVWTIFAILYDMNGGHNEYGQPFIFKTVDWSQKTMVPMIKYMYSIMILILFNTLWTFIKNLILLTTVKKINSYISNHDGLESDDSELDQILL